MLSIPVPPLAEVDGDEGDRVDGQPAVPAGAGAGGIRGRVPLHGVGVGLLCRGGDEDDVLPRAAEYGEHWEHRSQEI